MVVKGSPLTLVRRYAPILLLVVGAGLLTAGLMVRPHVDAGYISPHPWADYVTGGAIIVAAGMFEAARRVLRQRDMPTTTIVVVAVWLAGVVAMVVGAVVFIAMR